MKSKDKKLSSAFLQFAIVLIAGTLFLSLSSVHANEGAEEGHGGAPPPAAEGGEHGAAAPGAAPAPPTFESGRQSMEWVDLLSKLSAAKGKLDAQKAVVTSLVSQKEGITKQDELKKHVDLIVEENKKLNKCIDEYESMKVLLKYRFPEKGIKELRKYERVEKQSIEAIEHEITTEGQLKKNLSKMKKQFKKEEKPSLEEEAQKAEAESKKSHKPAEPVQAPDSVTDSIIISR